MDEPVGLTSVHLVSRELLSLVNMQSKHEPEQFQELLQRPGTRPYICCSICTDNILAVKQECKMCLDTCTNIPVIGSIIKKYKDKPATRDSVVESQLCVHKAHFTCYVRFARKFKIDNLDKCLQAGQELHWKCPDATCDKLHTTASQIQVRRRTDYRVGFYEESIDLYAKSEYFNT